MSQADARSDALDYLLGDIPEGDRARLEQRLDEDVAFAAEVRRMRPLLGELAEMSPQAWAHVEHSHGLTDTQEAAEPASGRTLRARRPAGERGRAGVPGRWRARRGLRVVAPAIAGAVALAVALVLSLGGSAPTRSDRVALSALAGTPASSHATAVIAGSRRVQVDVQYLPPAAAGHHYELWLMTDTTHLVPVASFGVSRAGTARLSLPLPAPPSRYRYLNVSLQQAGESAISNVSVLRGPIGGA